MTLRFHDSATATVRDFVPLQKGKASLYYCGATVQGEPHIGHVRSALAFDQLTRWLQTSGYEVTVVRNVTDIDDKILVKAAENNEPWWALAYRFEQAFENAYDSLGILKPTYEPRATGHIPEMHALIQTLIERGHAYPALDDSGDVYFDVRSWKAYGSLTHQNIDDMQAAPDADPRGKRDPRDFALWKGHKDGDPETAKWESPWGAGRPGWHLECSAMVTKYLGTEFDIHGGGLDLRFPHHENEMAQSQAAGHGFANFWMHNGMVTYQGEKMSKSIGNTINPREMLELARPLVVRYYLGQAHYRSVLDYRPTSLAEAGAAVERIETFIEAARKQLFPGNGFGYIGTRPEAFAAAMDDDLNVPAALAVLHETVRAGNTALAAGDADRVQEAFLAVLGMADALGMNPLDEKWATAAGSPAALGALDVLVKAQLEARALARAEKNWAESDKIRDLLAAAGVVVADTAAGATWSLQK
ncbi:MULTISPECIES: cysteine--tRNA ligase [Arthrobacter]|uniref:Cysteine--tRNA ligase n=1 Tax=Arthrobacter psychrochitiniphilus TaxID=291045 RepID=A0A2V3DTC9_9MICC|nr:MULTISPECIES: cysteine--tRNA ligase [Arthrobacter]NYG15914.1 cysteinyl-tRNA synthetase [Arthrobacter psychrochitiniphilus]PXA66657.1 cysteine--tRNA ligase [Arthrobacter psychrochitiniphilus]